MQVEAAIDRLEVLGYGCFYEPGSDIPGGWRCDRNGGPSVGLGSDQKGADPFGSRVHVGRVCAGQGGDGRRAVTLFHDDVLAALLPEAVLPSDEELLPMVQGNWPVELEDGWILGFDRASNNRTLHVRYVEPEEGD